MAAPNRSKSRRPAAKAATDAAAGKARPKTASAATAGRAKNERAAAQPAATKNAVAKKAVAAKPVAAQPAGADKVKGPASYFPSIEKTYGKPVAHWFAAIDALGPRKHMELVAALKAAHGLGHGHANALVAYRLAQAGKS